MSECEIGEAEPQKAWFCSLAKDQPHQYPLELVRSLDFQLSSQSYLISIFEIGTQKLCFNTPGDYYDALWSLGNTVTEKVIEFKLTPILLIFARLP